MVAAVSEAGYLQGDETGRFNPKKKFTRAEAAVMIVRLLENLEVTQ